MSEVVVLGADGMLGRTFREHFDAAGRPYEAHTRRTLDVVDEAAIARVLGERARIIVNCTAYTDVDGAETNEALAYAVNADAVGALARHAARTGSLLVHFSTDYVFSGTAAEPYRTDHPRAPLNAYGRSKAEGERLIETSGARALVIRTSWLYAPWSKSFVRTIAGAAKVRPMLRVVNDQRGRPTSTRTLTRVSLELVEAGATGIFHVTDGGECTWHGLATEIARSVAPSCVVEPCTSEDFPRPAPRPAYSVLDLAGTERVVDHPMPAWQLSLADVLADLE